MVIRQFTVRIASLGLAIAAILMPGPAAVADAALPAATHFHKDIQPILSQYCFDCHADGANKGGISFDQFKNDEALLTNRTLWLNVLKNVRSGLMPPPKKSRPNADEQARLVDWIKFDDFGIDAAHPAAGRVTVRRLNRSEYHNTIRDLLGVDYDTQTEFPPDDTGYGFDDIGDVLNLSPMLLEKYLNAAETIVGKAVPTVSKMVAEKTVPGYNFNPQTLSYYVAASAANQIKIKQSGHYDVVFNVSAHEKFLEDQFDYNKCRLIITVDGAEFKRADFVREDNRQFHYQLSTNWAAGGHAVKFEVQPLTTNVEHVRSLSLRIDDILVRGPLESNYWMAPKNYAQFFPKPVPDGSRDKRAYAHELLDHFATRAFRRPVDSRTLDKLTTLAEAVYTQKGKTFEAGVAHAMVAVLASPRFLFRDEGADPYSPAEAQPYIEEYALASRLSYFLWSSMPDDELFKLAAAGELRKNLSAQVKRMLADPKSESFVQNFVGQWLQSRDVENVPIESKVVLFRDEKPDPERENRRARYHELVNTPEDKLTDAEKEELKTLRARFHRPYRELTGELRYYMRQETEMYFSHIMREDRDVAELIDSDYTYLNEELAQHYGLTNLNITGSDMRRVTLPPDCQRGGVLTMGTFLTVTSNPTRTSPVKRGLFVLENILGNPTPPPPPNIPPLEDSTKGNGGRELSLREALEIHRSQPLCNSCHSRMDPIGLAFENFNALGMWRMTEHGDNIDPTGKLITGESFRNVRELKHILATDHRMDFYRTLTEKLLTYAVGRGLEYYDVETVDNIVNRLQQENGRFSALLYGVIESAPFQRRQSSSQMAKADLGKAR